MSQEDKRPVQRMAKRRRNAPRVVIHVAAPGIVVIEQGTRADLITAPPGSRIERPKRQADGKESLQVGAVGTREEIGHEKNEEGPRMNADDTD